MYYNKCGYNSQLENDRRIENKHSMWYLHTRVCVCARTRKSTNNFIIFGKVVLAIHIG